MTFEKIAARWYLRQFAIRAVGLYMAACPDDPAVRRFRRTLADVRRTVTGLPFVIDVGGTPRPRRY